MSDLRKMVSTSDTVKMQLTNTGPERGVGALGHVKQQEM